MLEDPAEVSRCQLAETANRPIEGFTGRAKAEDARGSPAGVSRLQSTSDTAGAPTFFSAGFPPLAGKRRKERASPTQN